MWRITNVTTEGDLTKVLKYTCPNCENYSTTVEPKYNFCPSCGYDVHKKRGAITLEEEEALIAILDKIFGIGPKAAEIPTAWHPTDSQPYYTLIDGRPTLQHWGNTIEEQDNYAIGNIFRTEEECKHAFEKARIKAQLARHAEMYNKKGQQPSVALGYNRNEGVIPVMDHTCHRSDVLFTSMDVAAAAIPIVGEENLIKYYFEQN